MTSDMYSCFASEDAIPTDFHNLLRGLAPYSASMMHELPANAQVAVEHLVEKMKAVTNDPAKRSEYVASITSYFGSGESRPVTGTLRAFMIGCYNAKGMNLPLGCTPSCLASVASAQVGQDALVNCEDGVLHHDGKSLTMLNDKLTPHVYMYLAPGVAYPLKAGDPELTMLAEHGVEKISVISSGKSGYLRAGVYQVRPQSSGSSGWVIFWILVLIVLAIIIIAFAMRASKGASKW